jgi:Xaa-Pro dipeptidase
VITADEIAGRRERLLRVVADARSSGFVLFDQHYIRYFADFRFLATERPVAFAGNTAGDLVVFVPEFEVERARAEAPYVVASYPEYPGEEHPMTILGRVLADLGVRGVVGADQDGYPGILGYEGPPLSHVTGEPVLPLQAEIEAMLRVKSGAEIELIRESGRWCSHAHRLLQRYTRPGTTEADVSLRVAHEATVEMLSTLGDAYGGQLASSDGASAGYRGQIGRRSAWAHAIAHNIEFQAGDVLVSETAAPVWGYNAELERAMVIGEPTDAMRRLFDHTVAAQQVAFDALRPGVSCGAVDQAVLGYFEENGLMSYWRQHVGHAIGLRNHEPPFLDVGDATVIEPGMVFTIEPGLYDEQVGGFRHSDTVAVTPEGIDVLTDYPRDIESLTLPVD